MQAIKDYTKSIELSTSKFKAYFNRGNCYRTMNRLDESIHDLTLAVELEPRYAPPLQEWLGFIC